MQNRINKLPKIELHSHLEGTIKPKLALQISMRNAVSLSNNLFNDNGDYVWSDFASFLTAYDSVSSCLRLGKDYRDITYEYLANRDNKKRSKTNSFEARLSSLGKVFGK